MRISARNCLEGKIVAIKEGPVTTEVTIETAAGEKIVSSITTNSAQNLGLKVGDKAYAVIKASSVMFESGVSSRTPPECGLLPRIGSRSSKGERRTSFCVRSGRTDRPWP